MVAEPVKAPAALRVRVLEPCLSRLPEPPRVPVLSKVKLLALALTVTRLGETVPLRSTVVGTPAVSSKSTESPVLKATVWLLARLIQLDELPVSHVPLVLPLQRTFNG